MPIPEKCLKDPRMPRAPKVPWAFDPPANPYEFVIGTTAIALFLGVSKNTVRNWMSKHALPVFKLPSGRLAINGDLVSRWGYSRHVVGEAVRQELRAQAAAQGGTDVNPVESMTTTNEACANVRIGPPRTPDPKFDHFLDKEPENNT